MVIAPALSRPGLRVLAVTEDLAEAFEDVYRRHVDDVFRYALSQVGDRAAAEDVTAETFVAAYAAYGRVRPDAQGVRPWLFRIARNTSVDHHRQQRRRRLLSVMARSQTASQDVEHQAAIRADLGALMTAIAALPARDRQLVGLRVGAGLPYSEIGRVLGMNEAAALMATRRALERVRVSMGNADA
jgi:RNA polymerase sigma factor (sigma-70 family)